ncbi:lipoprotein YvcA [Bacillus glycinifermentans]|uniref:hypothetical protein n=1 Tax=Bacillus glycinifermentans TaxID=1664069 RepID=UPI0006534EA0|nr:hypothetical protein [Bacillus glycinifermentans]KMM63106.1 lipoprotein YvcA [Bacillus glycinifermentans]MEC0496867.1 lipoprotein YvcA [Bacillus glycinifermentans]MEC0539628.1 lipoprotein YvcA [Bacillus glycinifermentans]
MKKMMMMCFAIILAFTGGCSMSDSQKNGNQEEAVKPKDMDPKDLPQVSAFQDEKTREYMASTKEVEPGYYLLESKLKGFTMLFPEDGEYLSDYSTTDEENSESIGFQSYNKKTNILLDGQVSYYREATFIDDPETMLDQVSKENGYKGNYSLKKEKEKNVYSAFKKNKFNKNDRKYNFSFMYFGYIKSKKMSNLGIVYSFIISCKDDDQACSLDEKKAGALAEKMIDSITFLTDKREK